jgi:hypothetical protein
VGKRVLQWIIGTQESSPPFLRQPSPHCKTAHGFSVPFQGVGAPINLFDLNLSGLTQDARKLRAAPVTGKVSLPVFFS